MWGYGPGSSYGMMGGGFGYGIGPFGMIIWVVILIAIVAAIVGLLRSLATAGQHAAVSRPPRRSPGLDALEERYVKGEINRDEYLAKKTDIDNRRRVGGRMKLPPNASSRPISRAAAIGL